MGTHSSPERRGIGPSNPAPEQPAPKLPTGPYPEFIAGAEHFNAFRLGYADAKRDEPRRIWHQEIPHSVVMAYNRGYASGERHAAAEKIFLASYHHVPATPPDGEAMRADEV